MWLLSPQGFSKEVFQFQICSRFSPPGAECVAAVLRGNARALVSIRRALSSAHRSCRRIRQWARRETRAGAAAKGSARLISPAGGELTPTVRNARAPTIWVGERVHMRRDDQQYLRRRGISRTRTAPRTTASTGRTRTRRRSSTLTQITPSCPTTSTVARFSCATVSKPPASGATTCRAPI